MLAEIQLDMLFNADLNVNDMAIMRTQRMIALGGSKEMELALARIQLEPHEGRWMWAVSINSSNGSESGYRPLPKWGKFAQTQEDALGRAADELRGQLGRLSDQERLRVIVWLGGILSAPK
ncbi:hypothetical protein AAG587_17730 [Vreelandella neptunia]|uniref:hypothetical protein n=1 Tax=Vreelandella neptunia TaxID=115551 RepID=UPI00315A4FB4